MRIVCLLLILLNLSACSPTTEPSGAARPHLLWTHADPAGGDALPYADAELAVFTTIFDRRVVGLDVRSGALRWQHLLTGGPSGLHLPPGNVLASGNLILVPGWDLYALDRVTGQVRWHFAPKEEYPAAAPLAMEGERIFSPGATRLYAVDVRSGSPLWSTPLGERPFAPVVDGGVVYLGTRGFINNSDVLGAGHAIAVRAEDGAVLWRVPIPDAPGTPWQGGINRAGALTPELFIVSSTNGSVYGIERQSGRVRWEHRGPGPYESGVAVLNDVAISASLTGEIIGLDANTGVVRWRTTTGG
ncbi:MAG TPA: PQQ-binding-like beta-propeller repeat protein, partial [Longimicrobiaceae bacterium]|nr:PQQ-binding-like beta-propeller repeat protein [Longimicrobiaceae bacterium]